MAEAASGPGAEGQPAPLSPQARTDINAALKNAGVQGLDYSAKQDISAALSNASAENLTGSSPPFMENPGKSAPKNERRRIVNKGALPEDGQVMGGLAIEGMGNDPRIERIKQELTEAWELLHGSRYGQDGVLRGDYQDYIFGNPADLKAGKRPTSLDDRVKQVFRERFPEDAKAYEERGKIYEDPNKDPAIQAIEAQILQAANSDAEVNRARADYVNTWNNTYRRFSHEAWVNFVRLYPEKANAYRNKFAPLQQITGGMAIPSEPSVTSTPTVFPTDTSRISPAPNPETSSPAQPSSEQQKTLDLTTLMTADTVGIDDFFALDKDKTYNNARRLVVHHDSKTRDRAQKFLM